MVIKLRRVQYIDTTAMYLLRQMANRLRRNGGTMVYANVFKHGSGTRKINKAFQKLGLKCRTCQNPSLEATRS